MQQPQPSDPPIDIEHALQSPSSVFSCPNDVLAAPGLDAAQRRAILAQWETDARHMEASEAEGFDRGEPAHLRQVLLAIAELEPH